MRLQRERRRREKVKDEIIRPTRRTICLSVKSQVTAETTTWKGSAIYGVVGNRGWCGGSSGEFR